MAQIYTNFLAKRIHQLRPALPLIAMILLFLVTSLTIWLAYRFEFEEKQRTTIADALWIRQSIEFQFNRDLEIMHAWAQQIATQNLNPKLFRERAMVLLKSRHELQALKWLSSNNKIVAQETHKIGNPNEVNQLTLPMLEAVSQASKFKYPIYSQIYVNLISQSPGVIGFDLLIPIMRKQRILGMLAVTYSLSGILDEHIPWWLAQEYEVSLADMNGANIASRSAGGVGRSVFMHQLNIDLSGLTLQLKINSIRGEPELIPNVLTGIIIILSLILMVSIGFLWRDIARRSALERALSEQYAFRKAMEDSLVTGLRARDLAGKVTYVNPAFCEMTGYSAEEIVGQVPPLPYWAPEVMENYTRRHNQILEGTVSREGYETIFKRKSEERFHALIFDAPLIDAQGKQTGWMSSILDISKHKEIEQINRQQQEKLQSTARLITMGELASTLSHELNQPLSAITSYSTACLNLLRSDKFLPEVLPAILEKINQQAQRAGQVIRSVHEFVRKRPPQKVRLNLPGLIQHTLLLIELQALQYEVDVTIEMAKDLPEVYVDRVMIEQVLLNLTRNGIEAMQHVSSDRKILSICAKVVKYTGTPMVKVVVIDRGTGVAPEVQQQLFANFVSTKTEGMGMGLTICRTAVEYHGGRLNYEENIQGGSLFWFTLPIFSEKIIA